MKLYSLSSDPSKPCFVLRFKGIVTMLDCGLSLHSLLDFLPSTVINYRLKDLPAWKGHTPDTHLEGELKVCEGNVFIDSCPEFCPPLMNMVNFSEIDVILISNYAMILALPFISEDTGFRGEIFATEPTLQIGRFLFRELVEYIQRIPKKKQAIFWKNVQHLLPSPLCDSRRPKSWIHLFTVSQIESCLNKVKTIGYNEDLDIFGCLHIKAVSSGYRLGSCNWVISTDYEKIVYISSSSTLATHPRLLDKSQLMNSNALILAGLRQNPTTNPETILGELCMHIAVTVRSGGNVLLPCYPSGVVYDLFECVSGHLDSCGLSAVPIFFLSPSAEISLVYSNILGEWLSDSKQQKIYLPEEPFPHAYLVKLGHLKHYKNIYSEGFGSDFKQPCVIFCGHPSLRFGDVVHFIYEWASNPLHTLILTEPDFEFERAVAPFQPLAMKVVHCPIDTSLNFSQANRLLRELQPNTLVVPSAYTKPHHLFPKRSDLLINQEAGYTMGIDCGEVVRVPVKRQLEKAELSGYFADQLRLTEVRPGISLGSIIAILTVKDNIYRLLEPEREQIPSLGRVGGFRYEFGEIDIERFLRLLRAEDIPEPSVQQMSYGFLLSFKTEQTQIIIEQTSTNVLSTGQNHEFRRRLRKILMDCLGSF